MAKRINLILEPALAASLLELLLQRGDHLLGGIERASGVAAPHPFQRLFEAGIDHTALRGRVFVVGVREFRTVDHRLRREHDLAALKRGLHEVALQEAGFAPDAVRDGYLAFVLNLDEGWH